MKVLRICHLYGNLMNTYGDNGNLLMLQYYGQQAGLTVQTTLVSIGDEFNAEDFDLVFFGGGQDYEQKIVSQDIQRLQPEIKNLLKMMAYFSPSAVVFNYSVSTILMLLATDFKV